MDHHFSSGSTSSKGTFQWPQPLQSEELLKLYDNDLAYALLIFEVFSEENPVKMKEFEMAIKAENWQETGEIAHQIKPHFKMVGWGKISVLIEQIETLSRKKAPDAKLIRSLLTTLQHNMVEVQHSVSEAIKCLKGFLTHS